MQIGMSFIGAYKMCAGEAAVADLAFAAKHAGVIQMADILPARRARGPNEPGGIKFGHFADMVQSDRKYPNDPVRSSLEIVAAGCMLFDQIWLGSYMSGGVGFTQYATAAYTDNILDDYTQYGVDYVKKKHGELGKVKGTQEVVSDIATEVNLYGMEQYETYPTALESHFGGSQRATVLAAASGISVALATANCNAGLNGWYLSMLMHKEGWSRLGFFGYDLQDQCGSANSMSIRPDEGLVGRTPWTELPELCDERRSPGRIRRYCRRCPHCTRRCMDPIPTDEDHVRRPVAEVRLLRSPPRVRKGCNPRVHARRGALTDHTRTVRSYQTLFF